jgi:hypothetical protein
MRIVKLSLTIAAAVFALIAAALWYKSSAVAVELDPNNFDSTIMVDDEGKQTDFIATALAQARWSKWAAAAAGTSAIFQAIALLLP